MPVLFPGSTPIDINTARINLNALGATANFTNISGDLNYLMYLTGNATPHALSDWRNVDFYGDVYLEQGVGQLYDACGLLKDHWCYYEGTTEYGGYVGPFGGDSTYNSERGYNNGTFLTFGYGYSRTRLRPYTDVYMKSIMQDVYGYSFSCTYMLIDIFEFGNGVVTSYDVSNFGYFELPYNFSIGFQQGRSFRARMNAYQGY